MVYSLSILFVAVYLPPQPDAGTKTTLNELGKAISKQENAYPEMMLIVAWDFNAGKLKSVLPNFYRHVTCATRGERKNKTLDHHNSILLNPAYKQKVK